MKRILILTLGIFFTLNIIAQKSIIEKENFMIIYNSYKDLNTESNLINTSSTFLSDRILLPKNIISISETYCDYIFKYGKPEKDESSEKTEKYEYNFGLIKGEEKLGANGEFINFNAIVAKKKNEKVLEIIKYKYSGEDIDTRYIFTYNNKGQITEKKALRYDNFYYINGVIHSEISKYTYTFDNKLKSCAISTINNNVQEKPYIIYKWEYNKEGMLIKETLSVDFFETIHYLNEYKNNEYGWVEKKSYKKNLKTKEWELKSITTREYLDEKTFRQQQEDLRIQQEKLKKQQKLNSIFNLINSITSYENLSFWNDKAINIFNSNKKLTFRQFETLLSSNKPYLCFKIDIISKYKKETKRITEKYQYSDGKPIEYQSFSLSELDKTIYLFNEEILKLIESIKSDLDELYEYETQLRNDISANDKILKELYIENGKIIKNKMYVFKTYTEYKEINTTENIEILEEKKRLQNKMIILAENNLKHLNKSLKKTEKTDDRINIILNYK